MKALFKSALILLLAAPFVHAEVDDGLKALFPEGVINDKGETANLDGLKGKPVIGLYFSAHWCPPCKKFTPVLVKYRNTYKDKFEMVFVSSDKSPEAQYGYMKETGMNCVTLKHRSDAANALSKKYGVRGIPTLVLVNNKGETITTNGRDLVTEGVAADKIATAKVIQEEYKCGKCDKIHTRPKLVFADEVAPK